MTRVELENYDNSWFSPGRSSFIQAAWFLVGSPIVSCHFNPSSSLRRFVLRLFGAKIGANVVLKPGVRVKFPWRLEIGENTWIGEDCWIDSLDRVSIGSNVCLSQGCYLCTGNHDWSDPSFGLIVKPIHIGDGAWAGAKSVIGPGVTLGSHAIASAGSVVFKSIPDFEIHRGNPAVFVRRRDLETGGRKQQAAVGR
jgi:putative colanic acid biosynthesis acetyltransferase WcaF